MILQDLCLKYNCYIIIGNESYLIKQYIQTLLNKIKKYDYTEYIIIIIDDTIIWKDIFTKFCCMNFFYNKHIINLIFYDKNHIIKNKTNIKKILKLLNNNIILIIEIHNILNPYIYKKLLIEKILLINNNHFIKYIIFNKLNDLQSKILILKICKKLTLSISDNAINLLQYFYKNNISLINQVINNIALTQLYTHINRIILYNYIGNLIDIKYVDLIHFILIGEKQKSFYIINMMKVNKYNPLFIINNFVKYIIYFIQIKRNIKNYNLEKIFLKFNIPQYKYQFITKVISKISNKQLYLSIEILLNIDINIKNHLINNYIDKYIWIDLEKLIFLF
ncbi:DNA polymerase III subunit delta [Enterobacteriaceae endosymbiont of Neohaemonia nigricornis]|uniref:DNA polymerase III subunit delta n=1 Tax=Enterobacteriaceae endosymbiont of Neohaemonia nigricornis TaxID=2675792 RepID=UPI001449312E|nr:hypothetical protein [Enterobacteriaceae endosymbiont of Neohaemonia nigricornis]QJC30485.1 hypothetical protein GJT85_01510 [Enterobacteriaceae endosymbiont of Neohaemonia nigricornis]